jgi:hypothetical protein
MNFLPEKKKYGLPSWNFVKKNVLCEKDDEITRFDGRYLLFRFIKKRFKTDCIEKKGKDVNFTSSVMKTEKPVCGSALW